MLWHTTTRNYFNDLFLRTDLVNNPLKKDKKNFKTLQPMNHSLHLIINTTANLMKLISLDNTKFKSFSNK